MPSINEEKLNEQVEELCIKQGEYTAFKTTIGKVYNAVENNVLTTPPEQREVKAKGETYRKTRDVFLAFLLITAFINRKVTESTRNVLKREFGDDIVFTNNAVQFIGVSMDKDGNLLLSDGQHRFLYYLRDFFNGIAQLCRDFDYGSDYLNERMEILFNSIDAADGDGPKDQIKISYNIFNEEQKTRIRDLPVVVQFVGAEDEKERAALFMAMNNCVNITQADQDKANYGTENMYQAIKKLHSTLSAATKGTPANWKSIDDEPVRSFTVAETAVLKTLLDAPMSTLVPLVAHASLLTYLKKSQIGDKYQWTHASNQSQADQVRNFFKASHNMSMVECNKLLLKIANDVLIIGKEIYVDNLDTMAIVRGCKSLLVGQLNAMHNKPKGIKKTEFFDISRTLTEQLGDGYLPVGGGHGRGCIPYDRAFFSNAHRLRSKNELFSQWVNETYATNSVKEVA